MEKETLKKILDFLKQNENRNIPIAWKLINNEPLTEKELTIDRDLDLKGSTIKSLPEGLLLGGLNLTNCKSLTSLPEGMKVGRGGLNLTNCKSLTSLPKGLKVGENLYIKNSPLAKFSDESLKDMIGLNGYIKGKIVR
jgi:hypothetical protein